MLYNINKDKEEEYNIIENIVETLKIYINPELYKKEQEMKKENKHKTILDEALKTEFKNKGLSTEELKKIGEFFK